MQSHVWSNIQVKADPDQLHSLAASATVYVNALARMRDVSLATSGIRGGEK